MTFIKGDIKKDSRNQVKINYLLNDLIFCTRVIWMIVRYFQFQQFWLTNRHKGSRDIYFLQIRGQFPSIS